MIAYCFASGHIGFGDHVPRGALMIATGELVALHDFIEGVARHAYDGKTLIVPGLPEAKDQIEGVAALVSFVEWIAKGAPEGIKVFGHGSTGTTIAAPVTDTAP